VAVGRDEAGGAVALAAGVLGRVVAVASVGELAAGTGGAAVAGTAVVAPVVSDATTRAGAERKAT
jgi:hypothetical protein